MDAQNPTPLNASDVQNPASHWSTFKLAIIVLFLALIATVVFFFQKDNLIAFVNSLTGDQANQEYLNAQLKVVNASLENGNFALSASTSRAIVAVSDSSKDANTRSYANSMLALAEFFSGSKEQRIAAIQLTKQNIASELVSKNPRLQADQINMLLGYIRSANEQYVFDEVFSGEPFEKFLVKNRPLTSIKNLASYSNSLNPSGEALYRIADYYRSGVFLATTTASKKRAIARTVETLAQADALYPQESAEVKGLPFDYMVEVRRYLWQSYIYGDLARADATYLAKSEEMADMMANLYETRRDENGFKIAVIGARMADVYINSARYAYAVKGAAASADIKADLDALIKELNDHPSWHRGGFIALIREMAADGIAGRRSSSYQQYVALAKLHPPFKALLEANGWVAANFK